MEDDTSGAVYAFEDAMYSEWNDDFSDIRSFIEYEVLDGNGTYSGHQPVFSRFPGISL